jgi:hypothetical protein
VQASGTPLLDEGGKAPEPMGTAHGDLPPLVPLRPSISSSGV